MRIRFGRSALTAINQELLASRNNKALPVLIGVVVTCSVNPASAINGNTFVSDCACQTSADFKNLALSLAGTQGKPSTFQISSTVLSSTAFIRVTGKYVIGTNGEPYWTATTATPVDFSSNSLAGNSESNLQGFFHVFDQAVFTLDRDQPLPIVLPRDYPYQSFVVTSDDQASAIINQIFPMASAPAGIWVSIEFPDHTKATYILQNGLDQNGHRIWKWSGFAWDAQGNIIGRDGRTSSPINTSGHGGGVFEGSGFGSGSAWNFRSEGADSCTSTTTITVNGQQTSYVFVAPC
jgi:hypothetical protein